MFKLPAGLALATMLAACSATTLQTNLQKLNTDISTFNTNVNADLSVLSQNLGGLCTAAAVLNAGFLDAAALSSTVAANATTEAQAYALVNATCTNPPTNAAQAATALIGQVQAIQAMAKGAAPVIAAPAVAPASN